MTGYTCKGWPHRRAHDRPGPTRLLVFLRHSQVVSPLSTDDVAMQQIGLDRRHSYVFAGDQVALTEGTTLA